MNYILFDSASRNNLLPLTFTRPAADIRIGILTIREKWELFLNSKTSSLTESYLSIKYPLVKAEINVLVNGSICPNPLLVAEIKKLKEGQAIIKEDTIIAMCLNAVSLENIADGNEDMEMFETETNFMKVHNTWDIFNFNDQAIKDDFALLTNGRKSQLIWD